VIRQNAELGGNFRVAIIGCHLKDKGNKVSQHLLPRKAKVAMYAAKPVVFATRRIRVSRSNVMEPKGGR
jgi:hypothetical protein